MGPFAAHWVRPMTTYAIGDVQGCHDELMALLALIDFNADEDELWFTGDLVNRGPHSLEVLRFVRGLGTRAITVLGNHDLHLLAIGNKAVPTRLAIKDTLQDVIRSPDCNEILEWLCQQPLLHHDNRLGFTMVHAGLPPQWDLLTAMACAGEVEAVLRGPQCSEFLQQMYGDQPDIWSPALRGMDRLRFICNCFTRLRFCDVDGRLNFTAKGPPGTQPRGELPWFAVPGRKSGTERLVFGHWSTLRLTPKQMQSAQAYGLDSGCFWGGKLTAMRLPDGRLFSVTAGARAGRKQSHTA